MEMSPASQSSQGKLDRRELRALPDVNGILGKRASAFGGYKGPGDSTVTRSFNR